MAKMPGYLSDRWLKLGEPSEGPRGKRLVHFLVRH